MNPRLLGIAALVAFVVSFSMVEVSGSAVRGNVWTGWLEWIFGEDEMLSVCGNGIVESGETCDDSNIVEGDGCSATCQEDDFLGDDTEYCPECDICLSAYEPLLGKELIEDIRSLTPAEAKSMKQHIEAMEQDAEALGANLTAEATQGPDCSSVTPVILTVNDVNGQFHYRTISCMHDARGQLLSPRPRCPDTVPIQTCFPTQIILTPDGRIPAGTVCECKTAQQKLDLLNALDCRIPERCTRSRINNNICIEGHCRYGRRCKRDCTGCEPNPEVETCGRNPPLSCTGSCRLGRYCHPTRCRCEDTLTPPLVCGNALYWTEAGNPPNYCEGLWGREGLAGGCTGTQVCSHIRGIGGAIAEHCACANTMAP